MGEVTQTMFGQHVESISFPLDNTLEGVYRYYVREYQASNNDCIWLLEVVVDGEVVETQQGIGVSDIFEFGKCCCNKIGLDSLCMNLRLTIR